MSEPTEAEEPVDLTPQPNQILATPDTVEACAEEYDNGADVRHVMGEQIAGRRH